MHVLSKLRGYGQGKNHVCSRQTAALLEMARPEKTSQRVALQDTALDAGFEAFLHLHAARVPKLRLFLRQVA